MRTPLARLIAWRYICGSRTNSSIATMALIAFLGILIGAFSLTVVVSVMNGFEKATYEKLQHMHAPIIIEAYGQKLNMPAMQQVLKSEFPQIESFAPRSENHVIINENNEEITNVVLLKGIDSTREGKISAIEKTITNPQNQPLEKIVHNNHILIGRKLANQLGLTINDPIELLYTTGSASGKKIALEKDSAIIGGLFHSGVEEFDTNVIVCSLDYLQKLFPDEGITQVGIKLKDSSNEQEAIDQLRSRFMLDAYSWKALYPALVAALKLEKYAMFFILALITLVASMSIISLLYMQIIQKRGDIAILKAHGLSDRHIQSIFLWMGMGITTTATLLGELLAFITCLLIKKYPFIQLPDVYYVSHLPVQMEWQIFAIVFVVVLMLGLLATIIPVQSTRSINIARVLRYEA